MSDSRAVAHREPEVRQSDNLLQQVIEAARNPDIDAEKMKTLAELVNGQQDRERENEFNRDLNAAIMEMPVITRMGEIVIPADASKKRPERKQGRFARFEDIDRVCRPILARHNLAIRFEIGTEDGQTGAITVRPILSHANGYTERGEAMRVPADTSGSKNAAQAVGSSTQYGKRYAYCAMLNIVTEGIDDDAGGRQGKVVLAFEREELVRQEAREAAAAGSYLDWYTRQSPKDRGWLVQSGLHAELGGQPVIDAPVDLKVNEQDERDHNGGYTVDETDPGPEPEPTTSSGTKRTPVEMVEDFERKLDEVETSRGVIDLQAEPRILRWMEQLESHYPQLHSRVTQYATNRYTTLAAQERERARTGGGEKLI